MSNTESLNTQLANAVNAIAFAQERLLHASQAARVARNHETDARNKVNEAQRHFDDLVAEVKKSAPYDTEWRRTSVRVEAG